MGRVYIFDKVSNKNIEIHYKTHTIECKKCKQINKEQLKKAIKLQKNNDTNMKLSQIYQGKVLFCKDHPKGKGQQTTTVAKPEPFTQFVSRLPLLLRLIGRQ